MACETRGENEMEGKKWEPGTGNREPMKRRHMLITNFRIRVKEARTS